MTSVSTAPELHCIASPLGQILVALSDLGIQAVCFVDQPPPAAAETAGGRGRQQVLLHRVQTQLAEYFAGQRHVFDLPLAAKGTAFQHKVWAELCRIPYGETRSYGQLAHTIGQPGAARAVGMANNRNPIGLLVPCHRVIGSQGQLTGYAGGLQRKAWLLGHERRHR